MSGDIDRLVYNYIDRPDVLTPLLALKDRINATLELYNLTIVEPSNNNDNNEEKKEEKDDDEIPIELIDSKDDEPNIVIL